MVLSVCFPVLTRGERLLNLSYLNDGLLQLGDINMFIERLIVPWNIQDIIYIGGIWYKMPWAVPIIDSVPGTLQLSSKLCPHTWWRLGMEMVFFVKVSSAKFVSMGNLPDT